MEIRFIRAGVHGWKSTISSFAEWWAVYRKTYTPLKSARNRDAQIVAHFLPHFDAKRLDEITKSDIVRYLNLRRTQSVDRAGVQDVRQWFAELDSFGPEPFSDVRSNEGRRRR